MTTLIRIMAVGALAAMMACSDPPKVLQGKVVSIDTAKKVLVVQDEAPPNQTHTLDLGKAEVGGAPAPGNVVRVAYRDQGGTLVAGRVMNLTPQKKK